MKSNRNPTLTASKIALIYALVSAVWILFSDQLLVATATTAKTIGEPYDGINRPGTYSSEASRQ